MSPSRKREAAVKLKAEFSVSERRACQVIDQPRTSQRYRSKPRDDERALVKRTLELVRERPRFGYRRIAALLICLVGGGGVRVTLRDAHKHASPNAGWSEAAMAGVLARQLGGPVSYDGELTPRPTFGDGARPDATSLRAALSIYWRACIALWLIVGAVAWLR